MAQTILLCLVLASCLGCGAPGTGKLLRLDDGPSWTTEGRLPEPKE